MSRLVFDLKYAVRVLRKSPGFTLVAMLTLALGIGATTAIFSVVNGVLLQPLPYSEPERIVRVMHDAPEGGFAVSPGAFSPPDFDDLRAGATQFESLAAWLDSRLIFTGRGEPEELDGAFVSESFFEVLGIAPLAGRAPGHEEHVEGADGVAVVSARFARTRFGEQASPIGQTLQLGGEPYTVVGIMPATFGFPNEQVDVWLPISRIGEDDIPTQRGLRWMSVMGRLAPTASVESVTAEVDAIAERLARAYPESNEGWNSARAITLHDALVGDVRPALLALFGAVSFVLLIVCANLANLLLARGNARTRELAVRTALGANRLRLARQVLTESVLLSLCGGIAGLLLAAWGIDALVALAADAIPRPEDIRLDIRVVGFALLASVFTGIVFGLLPSLTASHVNLRESLGEGGHGATEGRASLGMRSVLVATQVALAVVLLVGAGLLMRSFWNLTQVNPGFDAENVLTLSVSMPPELIGREYRDAYRSEIVTRIESLPGVIAVGTSKVVPLKGEGEPYAFTIPGRAGEPVTPEGGVFPITAGYFEALGIPMLQGRTFNSSEEAPEGRALIVNRAFAERYLADREAVGATLEIFGTAFRIVGIAGDVRHEGVATPPEPAVYVSSALLPRSSTQFFVRTSVNPMQLANAVRDAIWEVNPDQPIAQVASMRNVMAAAVSRPRLFTFLLGAFGALAVLLAAIGIYGVIAYSLGRRTQEFGIRMALGANGSNLLGLLIRQGLVPVSIGTGVGLVLALLVTRVLASQLYGIGTADPLTFAAVALGLMLVAFLATCIPARRAARLDPMQALRTE